MKKLILALSVLSLAGMTSAVQAAQSGDLRFNGTITASTCDIETEVVGNVTDLVQLGSVQLNTTGADVPFRLKTVGVCTGLNAGDATITWTPGPGGLDNRGLRNGTQSGAATGAWAQITSVNHTPGDITDSNMVMKIPTTTLVADGATYKAKLHGMAAAGSYVAGIAYGVVYP